jgi:hypothetical protein
MSDKGPFIHWRGSMGTALCGLPAKQDQLVNAWQDVSCPHCHRRSAAAVRNMRGAA